MSNWDFTEETFLGSYRFIVEINDLAVGYFKSVSGLNSKNDVIEYKLGGNRSVRRRPGRVAFGNISLEKGFSTGSDLFDWRQLVVDGAAKKQRKDGSIILLDNAGEEAVRYNFFRAWPVAWEGPSITAGAAETAIEKIELAVEWVQLA